jgi:hypothetical protein
VTATASPALVVAPGYSLPGESYSTPPVRRTSHRRLFLRLGVGAAVLCAVLVAVFAGLAPNNIQYVCPPDCGTPPLGQPVVRLPRFTSADGTFSVAFPAPGSAYEVTKQSNGVTAKYTGGDGGTLQLFSEPAKGRTPAEITRSLLASDYPDAVKDYEIPNAMVGYHLGYGEVADVYPHDSSGKYTRLRVLIMAAVKNDLALVAAAIGPYRQFTPAFGTGQPSGANLELALDMSKYVNSFAWRGDPPR